jgi:hypothetical protein
MDIENQWNYEELKGGKGGRGKCGEKGDSPWLTG